MGLLFGLFSNIKKRYFSPNGPPVLGETLPSLDSFGAVGDYREAVASIASGSKTPTFSSGIGITVADIGKWVQIAQASAPGSGETTTRDFFAQILSDGNGGWTLSAAATATVTNAPAHIATNDSPAIRAGFAAGGFYVPDNGKRYCDQFPNNVYTSGTKIHWLGTGQIIIANSPGRSYTQVNGSTSVTVAGISALGGRANWCQSANFSAIYNTYTGPYVDYVEFVGRGPTAHLRVSPAHMDNQGGSSPTERATSGICISYCKSYVVDGVNFRSVNGGSTSFALKIISSNNGRIRNLNLTSIYGVDNGMDTLHFLGNCDTCVVDDCVLFSGDDASAQTQEQVNRASNCVIQNITYNRCTLLNIGHSGIKTIVGSADGEVNTTTNAVQYTVDNAIVQDITYNNCISTTYMPGGSDTTKSGHGNTIYLQSMGGTGIVRRITINGGIYRLLWPGYVDALLDAPADLNVPVDTPVTLTGSVGFGRINVFADKVDDLTLNGVTFIDTVRTPFQFSNCTNLVVKNCVRSVQLGVTVTVNASAPVFTLTNCTNYSIQPDNTGVARSFTGQTYLVAN